MRDPVMIGPGGRQRPPRPLLRTTLGHILRRARREQGRTLADVAEAARVSMPYLSELERGRKEASSEVLAAVCDALRIELSDLLAQAGRNLADERARRALNEERARRIKERTGALPADFPVPAGDLPADFPVPAGDLPADFPVPAGDLPADVPASTGQLPADVSERASEIPVAQPLDVPMVVSLDAVRRRGTAPAGHHDGDVRASLAA